MELFNVYCDESCHLEHDRMPVMVLGAVWCPQAQRASVARLIRALKVKHGLPRSFEMKWTKVSPGKVNFYLDLIDLFFEDQRLHFRGLVIPKKSKLNHAAFDQSHDDFYYKMFFQLLTVILKRQNSYQIFLDIKDTCSQKKVRRLRDYLSNAKYDFNRDMITHIQQVHSYEAEQMQVADILIGALSHLHRNIKESKAKQAIIERIQRRSGLSLLYSTLPSEEKFNVFVWGAQKVL